MPILTPPTIVSSAAMPFGQTDWATQTQLRPRDVIALPIPFPIFTLPYNPQIQWSAHFETGNLSEYDGQNTTGNAISTAVTAASEGITAHGGSWVMKQTVTAPSGTAEASGTRMYVYGALNNIYRTGNPIYYSFWAWFPASFTWTTGGFYQLVQIQSTGPVGTDPVWILGVHPTNFTLRLEWWGSLSMSGPHSGESGGHTYDQSTVIPTGQWIFIEVMVTPREDYTGAVKIWQDRVVIFDQTLVHTKYPESFVSGGTQSFFIAKTAYGQNFATPNIQYVDDVTMSLGRMP
jgi:hypothetical protein